VYPARLAGGTSPRVRVSLRFDEPMDPASGPVEWSAQGEPRAPLAGTWSSDGTTLELVILGSPIAGRRPLDDLTLYELDLRALRDLAGNTVEPAAGLADGLLRFTSGVYDPLLNHACGHVVFGPFAAATATAAATPLAERTDTAHTRYTIALPGTGGSHAGYTRLRAVSAGTWSLFLDGEVPVALETDAGVATPVALTAMPDACDGITHRATFPLTALEQRYLRLGPIAAAEARLIVEIVAAASS
jgi:hypothetical protein